MTRATRWATPVAIPGPFGARGVGDSGRLRPADRMLQLSW